jgi:hypothetical protein
MDLINSMYFRKYNRNNINKNFPFNQMMTNASLTSDFKLPLITRYKKSKLMESTHLKNIMLKTS